MNASPGSACFLLADDHPIVMEALCRLLASHFPEKIIHQAQTYAEAIALAGRHPFQLAIVDLDLGKTDGLELVKYLHAAQPQLAILVFTLHHDAGWASRALRAGALGYLPKDEASDYILTAIRTVLRGRTYLPPGLALAVAALSVGNRGGPDFSDLLEGLSDREVQTFRLLGEGLSIAGIARRLSLSVKTIETYRERLKEKMHLSSAQALRERAIQWRLAGGQ